ncbi:hypothetical protein [Amycolatopsis sp. NPDC000740]|uniref:hypothetical protein n=1 Tax=Amycolatopsis sp. NPDC000740 TaxID=3154269 RepID=UPI00331C4B32
MITHKTSSSEAPMVSIMLGIATLTAVKSSRVRKNPRLSVTSTAQGLPRQRFIRVPPRNPRPA